jgi:hypothetical protein
MANLSEISKLPRKGAEYSPTHRMWVGGDNFTEELRTCDVTYTSDGGGSGAQIQLRGDLSDYDNAPVDFNFGYGDEVVPWFTGRLQRPKYYPRLDYTTADAFGPFRLMADQIIEVDTTYDGFSLRDALNDLILKAAYKRGEVEIRGGGDFIIEGGELFVWNNTLGEIAASLMDKAQFIGTDVPVGKRIFRKRPRPGVLGPFVESYSPDEYWVDNLDISPATEISYAKVTVQRVAKNGTELGKYSQLVGKKSNYPVPSRRVWYVENFLGDAASAQQEARETARWLRLGDYGFSFTIPLNPTLTLFDILQIKHVSRGKEWIYKGAISGDISSQYQAPLRDAPGVATMSVSGDAIVTKNGV